MRSLTMGHLKIRILVALVMIVFSLTLLEIVLFSRSKTRELEVLFVSPQTVATPADRCTVVTCKRLLELIRKASTSIDFAVYGMRNQTELLEELKTAQARGVKLRGIVDRDKDGHNYYSSTDLWVRSLGNIRDDRASERASNLSLNTAKSKCDRPIGFNGPLQCVDYDLGERRIIAGLASREPFEHANLMHHKFFIVDGRWVWTGSSNISDSGTGGYNANIVGVFNSKEIADVFKREFDLMWEGNFNTGKIALEPKSVQINDVHVTPYFSPQDSPMRDGILPLIASAQKRVDIAVFFLTHKDVPLELIKARSRGVKIRVIIDATGAKNEYTKHEILREAGIQVKVENWGGKMHMKAAAIDDDLIIIGSMNWTSAGENSNDENTLVVRSKRLRNEFTTFFDSLWNSIPDKWSGKNARPDPESINSNGSCFDGIDNDFDDMIDLLDPGCGDNPPPLPSLPPFTVIHDKGATASDKDCEDFKTWSNAQSFYELAGGPKVDPHRLDQDRDGIACSTLPGSLIEKRVPPSTSEATPNKNSRIDLAPQKVTPKDEPMLSTPNPSDWNCADFDTQAEAQHFYEEHGGPGSDPFRLDRDRDGEACESLPESNSH